MMASVEANRTTLNNPELLCVNIANQASVCQVNDATGLLRDRQGSCRDAAETGQLCSMQWDCGML